MTAKHDKIKHAIDWIRTCAFARGESMVAAARIYKFRYPDYADDILDEIGMFPSTQPELSALQKVAP